MGANIKDLKVLNKLIEIEPQVFSAALGSYENICLFSQYEEDNFYSEKAKSLFRIIKRMYEQKKSITTTTIYPMIQDENVKSYLIDIAPLGIPSYQYETLFSRHQDLLRRFCLIGMMQDAINSFSNDEQNCDEIFIDCVDTFYNTSDTKEIVSVQDLCKTSIKDISKKINYTPFGIGSLDAVVTGAYDGQMICIGGSPGDGKSTAALQAAKYQSTKEPVLFFSLEMSEEELYTKMISNECRIDSRLIENGKLDDEELSEAGHARDQINKRCQLYLRCGSLTESQFFSIVRKMVYQKGVKRVYLDYGQLVTGMKGKTRNDELENFSMKIKNTAQDLKISIVVLSQLTKDIIKEDRAPTLGDLRGSLAFGQDGDVVIFFYKAKIKTDKLIGTEPACVVAKQRKGEVGKVKGFKYNKKYHMMS